jgi:hypothetical protein
VALFGDADGDYFVFCAVDGLRIEAAERRETSCSPERPPKRMPTRNFFFAGFFSFDMGRYKFVLVWVCTRKKVGGVSRWFYRGFCENRCAERGFLMVRTWWIVVLTW